MKNVLVKKKSIEVFGKTTPGNFSGGSVIDITDKQSIDEEDILGRIRNNATLIETYRSLVQNPDVSFAVEEIVNEAITIDDETKIVEPDVFGEADEFEESILDAWNDLYERLKIKQKAVKWFEDFYVDAFLYLEKVRDRKGRLRALRWIDPKSILFVRLYEREENRECLEEIEDEEGRKLYVVDEFYLYFERPPQDYVSNLGDVRFIHYNDFDAKGGIRIEKDDIIFIHSDKIDPATGRIIGYLHGALKQANKLSQLEDYDLVHTISRAPQRLAFYLDVGNMPPDEAVKFVQEQATKYRNKIEYDPETGKIITKNHTIGLIEDFWLLRQGGSRGTEISTVGGDATGIIDIEKLSWYRERLMMALKVPISRFQSDAASIVLGTHEEITREEAKFAKFIQRLRNIFEEIFYAVLEEELVFKKVFTKEEWEYEYKQFVNWKWAADSYYSEVKELNILSKRAEVGSTLMSFESIPEKWVLERILKLNAKDFQEIEDVSEEEGDFGDEEDMGDFERPGGAQRPGGIGGAPRPGGTGEAPEGPEAVPEAPGGEEEV